MAARAAFLLSSPLLSTPSAAQSRSVSNHRPLDARPRSVAFTTSRRTRLRAISPADGDGAGAGGPGEDGQSGWETEAELALNLAAACAAVGLTLPFVNSVVSGAPLEAFLTHFEMIALTILFGVLHSGLASLRPRIAEIIGERAYRVLFAFASLPSAVFVIYFFIAHRYDGLQMWTAQGVTGVKEAVIAITALSFYFLYPATFNLLEVAAIFKPSFRIYETGIMRITRHPQLWGQVLWCISHTLWIGNTMAVSASMGLLAHHFFGAWNGDRRLREKYGSDWEQYADRTSFIPFQAIIDGRQQLRPQEFIKPAYLGVTAFIWVAYHFHPDVLRLVGQF